MLPKKSNSTLTVEHPLQLKFGIIIVQLRICLAGVAGADVMLNMNPVPGIGEFVFVSVAELSHLKLVPVAAAPGSKIGGVGELVVFVNKFCWEYV